MAQIIVAKHRNGQTGDVTLRFIQSYAKFTNVDITASSIYDGATGATLQGPASTNIITMSSKMNDLIDEDTNAQDAF